MRPTASLLAPLAFFLLAAAPAKDTPAARMLSKIALLEGRWDGEFKWTEGRSGSGKMHANYYVTGMGLLINEHMTTETGGPYMSSVYHLDGPDLRVTHYCGAQNQPRLRADHVDDAAGTAHFAFVDVTNAGPKSGYVEEISINTPNRDSMQIIYVFKGNGPRAVEVVDLK